MPFIAAPLAAGLARHALTLAALPAVAARARGGLPGTARLCDYGSLLTGSRRAPPTPAPRRAAAGLAGDSSARPGSGIDAAFLYGRC
ncbi:MAG TPA: hypothetical protein VFX06_02615 [Stellaceae bacterium]|nr:hypothetical protein [Stellaceae bacterium]